MDIHYFFFIQERRFGIGSYTVIKQVKTPHVWYIILNVQGYISGTNLSYDNLFKESSKLRVHLTLRALK